MPVQKLREYLEEHNINFVTIHHSTAYTAQEVAHAAHISGKEMAKTVMIKVNGKMAMAVLPANYSIDLSLLRNAIGAESIELAHENEFVNIFPDCELGAMPPFGNLYGLDVYTAQSLTEDDEIAFNAGNHTELLKLNYKDYETLVHPKIIKFSRGS